MHYLLTEPLVFCPIPRRIVENEITQTKSSKSPDILGVDVTPLMKRPAFSFALHRRKAPYFPPSRKTEKLNPFTFILSYKVPDFSLNMELNIPKTCPLWRPGPYLHCLFQEPAIFLQFLKTVHNQKKRYVPLKTFTLVCKGPVSSFFFYHIFICFKRLSEIQLKSLLLNLFQPSG